MVFATLISKFKSQKKINNLVLAFSIKSIDTTPNSAYSTLCFQLFSSFL